MEAAYGRALEQINKMNYNDRLRQDRMGTVLRYGIACYKKDAESGYFQNGRSDINFK